MLLIMNMLTVYIYDTILSYTECGDYFISFVFCCSCSIDGGYGSGVETNPIIGL